MISNSISNTATVRNVFIIDDKQIVRTILVYPMNIGRNIPEILRIVRALQVSDCNNQMAPANWMPNEPMILPMPQTFSQLQDRNNLIQKQNNGFSWYLSFRNPSNLCINNANCSSENRVSDSKNDVEKQISEKSSEPQTSNVKTKRNWPPKEIR